MVIHTNKKIKLNTTHKKMDLPEELRKKIEIFWQEQVRKNPNLFNGEVWNVTKMEETQDEIILTLEQTDYAHYIYDERHGIDPKYHCHHLSGGVYLVTKDGYAVVGELDNCTSYPTCLQVSGGGIDRKDIVDNEFDIMKTAERELKEELNLDLNDKKQIIKYNVEYLETPEGKRHTYVVIHKAIVNLTAEQLKEHFKSYRKYLEESGGELEFSKLYSLKLGSLVYELNKLQNPRRLYVGQMLEIEDDLSKKTLDEIDKAYIERLKAEGKYEEIFNQYGKEAYKKYAPKTYRKEDLKRLKIEGKYEDIYSKYGEKEYNKLLAEAMRRDIKENGGNQKSILKRIKQKAVNFAKYFRIISTVALLGGAKIATSFNTNGIEENAIKIEDYNKDSYNDDQSNFKNSIKVNLSEQPIVQTVKNAQEIKTDYELGK